MKNIISYVGVVVLMVITFFCGKSCNKVEQVISTVEVRDTLYIDKIVHDTIPKLVYKEIKDIKIDTLYSVDSIQVPVYIPIEQSIYSNTVDSIEYTAYVSGYKSSLDSIYFKYKYPIITNTITNTITKKDKFNFGVGLYGGYSPIYKNFDVIFGVGIQYNF